MSPIKVALLGHGNVGSQVARLLLEQADELAARAGAPMQLVGVAVRDRNKHADLPGELITADALELVQSDVDVVVELVGGIEPARSWVLAALRAGKSVVTANKALVAEHSAELFEAADSAGVDLYFEASVAGAIPVLRPLRESLAGDQITKVMGIVNGTTNYILSKMEETGSSYNQALAEASKLGYAEADPTADVDGYDAASKTAILASLAFHSRVTAKDVYREGISQITASDVAAAKALGKTVKLLAICERVLDEDGMPSVSARVHPVMIPNGHQLAGVHGAFNAIYVKAESAGELVFYGQGAGGAPTASAVLGDLVAVVRNRVVSGRGPRESAHAKLPIRPMGHTATRYHLSLDVADRPGVLAQVAQIFAQHNVSIATVRQRDQDSSASLVIVTHLARDASLRATVEEIEKLEVVHAVVSVMRVEGED